MLDEETLLAMFQSFGEIMTLLVQETALIRVEMYSRIFQLSNKRLPTREEIEPIAANALRELIDGLSPGNVARLALEKQRANLSQWILEYQGKLWN